MVICYANIVRKCNLKHKMLISVISRVTIAQTQRGSVFLKNLFKSNRFSDKEIILRRFQSPNLLIKYFQSRPINSKINQKYPLIVAFAVFGFGTSKTTEMTSNITVEDLQHADQLFDESKYQETIDVLSKFEDQSSSDIKWRLARSMYKLSKIDSKRKDELIRKGFELVDDALKINDQDFAIHKWLAILMDAKGELDGIKARVSQLETVKKHMIRAVELNPEDPTSWHLLGNFAYGLAEMPWYQRKIVSAIFATPPTGTYEEALEHFLKAEETKPNFYSMNLLLIGKCYQQLKNDEKAKHYLSLASNVIVSNEDDKKCKEEATALLKKY